MPKQILRGLKKPNPTSDVYKSIDRLERRIAKLKKTIGTVAKNIEENYNALVQFGESMDIQIKNLVENNEITIGTRNELRGVVNLLEAKYGMDEIKPRPARKQLGGSTAQLSEDDHSRPVVHHKGASSRHRLR